jgi:hypothetical protein
MKSREDGPLARRLAGGNGHFAAPDMAIVCSGAPTAGANCCSPEEVARSGALRQEDSWYQVLVRSGPGPAAELRCCRARVPRFLA